MAAAHGAKMRFLRCEPIPTRRLNPLKEIGFTPVVNGKERIVTHIGVCLLQHLCECFYQLFRTIPLFLTIMAILANLFFCHCVQLVRRRVALPSVQFTASIQHIQQRRRQPSQSPQQRNAQIQAKILCPVDSSVPSRPPFPLETPF